MKAIILAAGRGSRMKALTKDLPKCLVKLRGKSLLDWQISALRTAGISEIAIVTGYLSYMLKEYNLVEFHNAEWAKTNMVTSLSCARSWLREGPCVVSYSDIFYDSVAIESLMKASAPIAVSYDPNWLELWNRRFVDPLTDAETFLIGSDKKLIEIGKKSSDLTQIQGQFIGITLFTPHGWNEFNSIWCGLDRHLANQIDMTGSLQAVIEAGKLPILGIPYAGKWGEVDSESDLILYENA